MVERVLPPTRVLAIGVRGRTKLEQRLDERFHLRAQPLSESSLSEINRNRTTDVVVVGEQHEGTLRGQLKSEPSKYRSYVSVGIISEDLETSSVPFDGIVAPPTSRFGETVQDIEHLARITEIKRKTATLYQLVRTLAEMETEAKTNGSRPSKRNGKYERLKDQKCDLENDVDRLISQVVDYDSYALFNAVEVAGGHPPNLEELHKALR